MAKEENKKIALDLLKDIFEANIDKVLDKAEENATWWILGNIPHVSGTKSIRDYCRSVKDSISLFPNGLRLTVDNVIAEGYQVVVEGRSHGELNTGKTYQNTYLWVLEIRDGKVRHGKTYVDTLKVKEGLLGG